MKCQNCSVSYQVQEQQVNIRPAGYTVAAHWVVSWTFCASCHQPNISLQATPFDNSDPGKTKLDKTLIYPAHPMTENAPNAVTLDIAKDFNEALAVLPHSAKASAALSRRCLQAILSEQGFKQSNLVKQIDAAQNGVGAVALPSYISEHFDAIRNFGNFSAHPITDITQLQVVPVEPHEAEWSLDILRDLFDHYYVKPALAKKQKAALDAKLTAAGKPPSK